LVVDDENLPRRAVSRWLGGLGLDVVAVASAAEALAILARERFDVVVADWLLQPPERGDHLLDEIRDRYPHMRRVLFSGQDVRDASSAHFFIEKPSSVETLERAVREHALGVSPFSTNNSDDPN
jgi:DNA-binding NtrC family response regulator